MELHGLREVNGSAYPAELIKEYCNYITIEKIKSQANSAHTYVTAAFYSSYRFLSVKFDILIMLV